MSGRAAVDRILVTGATGKVGRTLVPLLLEAGVEVRAATRDPGRARSMYGDRAEVVELDYRRTETYDAALHWADRVFLMPPPFDPDAYEAIGPLLDWAVSARVRQIVLLSGMTVPDVGDLSLRRMELHLEAQDTPSAILRPNLYMQNFHPGFLSREIRGEGRIRLPAGDGSVSFIDVRDVAAVAARILLSSPDDHQASAVLTGSEALDLGEAAAILSSATGREIAYEPIDEATFRELLDAQGWRPAEIDVILGLLSSVRKGWREPVRADAERILGRPPRSFAAFAEEHAAAWT